MLHNLACCFLPHTSQEGKNDTIPTVKKYRSITVILKACHFVTSLSLFSNLMGTNQETPFLSSQSTHPDPDLHLSE